MESKIDLIDNVIWLNNTPTASVYRNEITFDFRDTSYHEFVEVMENLPSLYNVKITEVDLSSDLAREIASMFVNTCTNYLYDHDWLPVLNDSQKLTFADSFRKVITKCQGISRDITPFDLNTLSVMRFVKMNPSEVLRKMEQRPDHWFDALILFKGKMNYPSGRPHTTMSKFLKLNDQPVQLTLSEKVESNTGIPIKIGNRYALPVTRYSLGMTRGLYFTEENIDDEYCGTFYYLEPGSSVYLTFNTFEFFDNKFVATYILASMLAGPDGIDDDRVIEVLRETAEYYGIHDYSRLVDIFMRTKPEDLVNVLPKPMDYREGPQIIHPQDTLDEALCLIAGELKIDVIYLAQMRGHGRFVGELLDARKRVESFASLIRVK